MNKIPPLTLPNLTAQVLHEGVLIEAKKGAVLSDADCLHLMFWLSRVADHDTPLPINIDVPTGTEHGFPLND